MPSSSTALNLGLWGVPFAGIKLNARTIAYRNAVQSAGGTVSSDALLVLDQAVTSTYNGLVFADYSSKFRYCWIPLSAGINGIIVPLIGNNFTNNGFVSGDWDVSSGLQGDGTSSLSTGIAVNQVSTFDNLSYGYFYVSANGGLVNRTGVRGGGNNATCEMTTNSARIGSNSSPNVSFSIPSRDLENTFYSASRFSTSSLKLYVDGNIDATNTVLQTASDTSGTSLNTFNCMSYYLNGSGTPIDGKLSMSFLAQPALTDAEMLSFAQMIAFIESQRSSL